MNRPNSIARAQKQQASYASAIVSPFTKLTQYQEKARALFDKLNNVREVIEDNKYTQHKKLSNQIGLLQQMLQNNATHKNNAFQKVLEHVGFIQNQIEQQKIQAQRNLLNLETKINSANRQCDRLFDKVAKERQDSESRLLEAINHRIKILAQRNKSLSSSPLYDESMIDSQPFLEQIQHLKTQVNNFYAKIESDQEKILNQFNSSMNQFKTFLNTEIQEVQNETAPVMECMKDLHVLVYQKIQKLRLKRQQIESDVINTLETIFQNLKSKDHQLNNGSGKQNEFQ